MENHSYIEFKQERDLGTILSDTFRFIRENWRAYFLTVLKICGPVLLIFLTALGFYMYSFSGLFTGIGQPGWEQEGPDTGSAGMMVISVVVFMIAAIALYVLMNVSSLYFVRSYIDNNGPTDFAEIKRNVAKNFWSFLGLGILVMLLYFVSAMLCFFPIIYTWVVLSLAFPIMVFEGRGVTDSIGHCFTLIKDHWFNTFGVLFVVALLVIVLSLIFAVPTLIYQIIDMGTSLGENDPTAAVGIFSDPIYLLLNILSRLGQFVLSSITLIASVFIYFDLNEQKNQIGTLERIDNLGQ